MTGKSFSKTTYSFLAILSASVALACCRNNGQDMQEHVTNNLADIEVCKIDCSTVALSKEMIHAKNFFVYRDSILIVLNKPSAGHILEIYEMHSGELITNAIMTGNGPLEMINSDAYLYGNSIVIIDFVKGNYVVMDIPELLAKRENYTLPAFQSLNGLNTTSVFPLYDSDNILTLNPYCFSSVKIGIDNKEPRFFYGKRDFSGKKLVNSANVSQGYIAVNQRDSLILYASADEAVMEIYGYNLEPKLKILGPTDMAVTHVLRDNQLSFRKHAPYAYRGVTSDENYIYATYMGNQKDNAIEECKPCTNFLKYDWSGRLIEAYRVDLVLNTISLTSSEHHFYVSGYDEDGAVLYEFNKL